LQIDRDLCIGCESCVPYCPVGAIKFEDGTAYIEYDECVECGVCRRLADCPVDAINESDDVLTWPRSVRKAFSDPTVKHEDTGVRGRGTEEVKTNDVTARFKRGFYGMAMEFGRPGVGTRLYEVEPVTKALAAAGVKFEAKNPLTTLMTDPEVGEIKEEVRNERVLSAIIEFIVPEERLEELVESVLAAAKETSTVFSWCLVSRFATDGSLPVMERLNKLGIQLPQHMKVNVGLGLPRGEE
jgi:Fe-S-cluster-containing hydrogenase component 2